MYEEYTRQSLPPKKYRELLGSAICVFNSNNAFIIENILLTDSSGIYSWNNLIDLASGRLLSHIKNTITRNSNDDIADLFDEIVNRRNRIVHSFQITDNDRNQKLATKDKQGNQYIITDEYLISFIRKNEILSVLLYDFRERNTT